MTTNPSRQQIVDAIIAKLQNDQTPEQQQMLRQWLSQDDSNAIIYQRICDHDQRTQAMPKMAEFDHQKAWEAVVRRVALNRRRKLTTTLSSLAVAATLIVGIIVFSNRTSAPSEYANGELIAYGSPKATVTFADGRKIQLDTVTVSDLGDAVMNSSHEMTFLESDKTDKPKQSNLPSEETTVIAPRYNIIDIPVSGEYKVTLPDGTLVYLNSKTTLRFAENFDKLPVRELLLDGEAYFIVAHNASKPFVVRCGGITAKALGTSFNMSNYADDYYSSTTVIEGEVQVTSNGQQRVLVRNQQIKLTENGTEYNIVSADDQISWINSNLSFNEMPLDQILRKLARWYDVEFVFAGESVANIRFSGYLPRYKNISEILTLLKMAAKVDFEVDGRIIKVKTRAQIN